MVLYCCKTIERQFISQIFSFVGHKNVWTGLKRFVTSSFIPDVVFSCFLLHVIPFSYFKCVAPFCIFFFIMLYTTPVLDHFMLSERVSNKSNLLSNLLVTGMLFVPIIYWTVQLHCHVSCRSYSKNMRRLRYTLLKQPPLLWCTIVIVLCSFLYMDKKGETSGVSYNADYISYAINPSSINPSINHVYLACYLT